MFQSFKMLAYKKVISTLVESKNVENKNDGKSEGEGKRDSYFYILQFSTFLPFNICTSFAFDQSFGNQQI
jgi:hypothetical protein